MNRERFLSLTGISFCDLIIRYKNSGMQHVNADTLFFKDDGQIPNSKYPLVLYKSVFSERGTQGARRLEQQFLANNWTNSWRWGVYPFHHYHSNTHEVLGVFSGYALLHLGGEKGQQVEVRAGDVIIIPAGVGHKCVHHSDDFTVVGAYPDGLSPDLNKGEPGERPQADKNIASVPFPASDPFWGRDGELLKLWK